MWEITKEFEFEAADGTYYVASYDYSAAARHTSYGSNSYDPPETDYDIQIDIDAIYSVDEEGERKLVYKNDPQQSIKTYPHEIRVVYSAVREAIEEYIIENRLDEWN